MRARHTLLALGTLAAAGPAAAPAAAAQDPAPAPTLRIVPERAAGGVALAGERIRVRGTVQPYVAGQTVTVRAYRAGRRLLARQVTVQPSSTGRSGTFVLGLAPRALGRVELRATAPATAASPELRAVPKRVTIVPARAALGSRGPAVALLQRMLDDAGYVVGARGVFDARTARAVTAFRKVTGMARTTEADATVFRRLARGGGRFKVRFPQHGRHVEADISRQVLALIGEGGKVERIYPTSTGAPATPTILGSFRVYRKDPGTNALGMVHSAYFIRGYAIHGFKSVPTYNASHGCLRVPVPDARSIYDWVRLGTRVDTYR
jgi:peptidoglycan hydrolase-like protein with peptidoglycan-binding domain